MTETKLDLARAGRQAISARQFAEQIRFGEMSARECLEIHLSRIDDLNPAVNALVTVDIDGARARALELDEQLADSGPVGVLHGLPVAIKDTHLTAGMRTTYGSNVFADHVPDRDALIVSRLREAGAIIVGKSNTPEFAAGSHTTNELFGPTRNPYDLNRSAGGSSGGAAAAVACEMVALADGSDLGGSLRNPASFCNVVGLRPTPGLVPMWPAWDLWDTCAVQGPIARTVSDIGLMMSAIAGPSERTPIARAQALDFSALDADSRGLRIGVATDLGGLPVEPAVLQTLEAARGVLEGDLGCLCEFVRVEVSAAIEVFTVLRGAMFVARYGDLVDDPSADIGENVRWNVEQGRAMDAGQVGRAGMRRSTIFTDFMRHFETYDYMVTYTSQVVPFDVDLQYPRQIGDHVVPDYLSWMGSCAAFSILGTPILAVPAGFDGNGLPIGIQIIGRPGDDVGVMRLGHAFMQANGAS